MIVLESIKGTQTANPAQWRTFAGAFDWKGLDSFTIRNGEDVFRAELGGTRCLMSINGVERTLPTEDVLPSIRLALSASVLRGSRFSGFVRPV
jgi:hypothetical protein